MEFWYSEYYSENAKFSIKVDKQLHSEQSDFQRIDFFESDEFGRFFTLYGLMKINEKDECFKDFQGDIIKISAVNNEGIDILYKKIIMTYKNYIIS